MAHGGKRHGAGRKPGIPNHLNVQTREDLWRYIAKLTALGKRANPLERLVDRMIETHDEHIEVLCARILIDRLVPTMQAVKVSGDPEAPLKVVIRGVVDDAPDDDHRVSSAPPALPPASLGA